MNIFSVLQNYKFISQKELIILQILQDYNCRISEVLEAKWKNFFPNQFLILEGKKKSRNIIIPDKSILSLVSNLPKHSPEYIFYPTKYHTIHRLCIRFLGDKIKIYKKRKNNKVTHFFRYDNISKISNEKFHQDILHHNSKRSAAFYKTKQKGVSIETQT